MRIHTAFIRMFVRDIGIAGTMEGGMAAVAVMLARLGDFARRDTRTGAGRNIGAHSNLGDDLVAMFHDETLTGSAAIFESSGATMADAPPDGAGYGPAR